LVNLTIEYFDSGVFDTGGILKGFKYFTISRRGNIVKHKIKSHKLKWTFSAAMANGMGEGVECYGWMNRNTAANGHNLRPEWMSMNTICREDGRMNGRKTEENSSPNQCRNQSSVK